MYHSDCVTPSPSVLSLHPIVTLHHSRKTYPLFLFHPSHHTHPSLYQFHPIITPTQVVANPPWSILSYDSMTLLPSDRSTLSLWLCHIHPSLCSIHPSPSYHHTLLGGGKSTLINLILRFYDPTSGCVMLDGHDMKTLRLRDVRGHIGTRNIQPSYVFIVICAWYILLNY